MRRAVSVSLITSQFDTAPKLDLADGKWDAV